MLPSKYEVIKSIEILYKKGKQDYVWRGFYKTKKM